MKKKSLLDFRMPKGTNMIMLAAVCLLALYGVVMVASASMGKSEDYGTVSLAMALIKPLAYAVIGFLMMCWTSAHFKLDVLKSDLIIYLIAFTLAALCMCLVFDPVNSAKAWIHIPLPGFDVTLQPSEFAKLVAILIVASYLGDRKKPAASLFDLLVKPLGIIGLFCAIVMIPQNDTGSALVIFLISCVCMLIPSNEQMKPWQRFLKISFWAVILFLMFLILTPQGEAFIDQLPLQPYQKYRITSAIDPFADEYGNGYQLISGLTAFAEGGLFGRGYGNSIRKYMQFPQAESDYILAILVEELGFVGFLGLMVLYCTIIYTLLSYALKMKSDKARIILVGVAVYLVFHIFLNIGGVTGMIPLTGVPLPLISAGGSSTMAVMTGVGLCQAVIASYKRGDFE